jgi:hypothetical protein
MASRAVEAKELVRYKEIAEMAWRLGKACHRQARLRRACCVFRSE